MTVGPPCHPDSMLSETDKQTLDLEAMWWRYPAQKDAAIRERFDETPTRYYQRLHELLRNPEAVQYAPLTVSRLLRLETARRAARTYPVSGSNRRPVD